MFSRPEYGRTTTDALGRKSFLALLSRLAPGLATLVVNIAIGRLGGSALLGLTQTIMSGASVAALAYPAGGAASRYLSSLGAQGERNLSHAVASHLARRVIVASSVSALVVSAVVLFGRHGTISVAILSSLMVLAVAGRAFIEGLHFGGGEGERLAKWSTSIATLSVAGTVALLLLGIRDVWVVTPLIVLNVTFVTFSWPRRSARRVGRTLTRELRQFVALSVIGTLASTGFGQSAVLIAGLVQGLAFVGQYSAALTMTTPLGVIASALGSVLFPALAATQGSGAVDAVRVRLGAATSAIVTLMVGAFIPLALLSEVLVTLLWGPKFPETSWIILFVLPAIVISTIAVPAVSAVTASSNRGMGISAASSVAGAGVGIIVWLVMIPRGNAVAIPLGFALGTIVIAAIPLMVAWHRYRMRWLAEAVLVVAAIAGTLAIVVFARAWLGQSIWYPLGAAIIVTSAWLGVRHRSVHSLIGRLRLRGIA